MRFPALLTAAVCNGLSLCVKIESILELHVDDVDINPSDAPHTTTKVPESRVCVLYFRVDRMQTAKARKESNRTAKDL